MPKLKITVTFEAIYDLDQEFYDERSKDMQVNQKIDHTLKQIHTDPWILVHNCTTWKTKGKLV